MVLVGGTLIAEKRQTRRKTRADLRPFLNFRLSLYEIETAIIVTKRNYEKRKKHSVKYLDHRISIYWEKLSKLFI